jgi:hypothetical protein
MRMRGLKLLLGGALVFCALAAGPAWAGTLDFNGGSLKGHGKLTFTPGIGDQLSIGTAKTDGALIQSLLNDVGLCGGSCTITKGFLTVLTAGESSQNTVGLTTTYDFNSGGSIDIYGGIAALGIPNGTLLLSAQLSGANFIVTKGSKTASFQAQLILSTITLDHRLGTYTFAGGSSNTLAIDLTANCGGNGKCSGLIESANLTLLTTPEPASLSFLGTGLLAVGCFLRKKLLS